MNINSALNKAKLFLLYAFVASLGFEYWDVLEIWGKATVPKLLGVGYFFLALASVVVSRSFNQFINRNDLPSLISLVLLWYWLLVSSFVNYIHYGFQLSFNFTLLQVILLVLVVIYDIRREPHIKNNIYIFFVLGSFLIFVLISFGIGVQSGRGNEAADSVEAVRRVWFMGLNPNSLGNLAALSFILCLHLIIANAKNNLFYLVLIIPLMSFPLMIGYSGSAGAFMTTFLGGGVLLLMSKSNVQKKIISFILGALCFFLVIYLLQDNETIMNKVNGLFAGGDASGRLGLWQYALGVIQEHFLIGVGGINGVDWKFTQLGSTHHTAHNTFLDVFMWGGLVGLILFTAFFMLLFANAFRCRVVSGINLALLVCVTFLFAKSGGGFTIKYLWLLLATTIPVSTTKMDNTNEVVGVVRR